MKRIISILLSAAIMLGCVVAVSALTGEQDAKISSELKQALEQLPEGETVQVFAILNYELDEDYVDQLVFEETGLTRPADMNAYLQGLDRRWIYAYTLKAKELIYEYELAFYEKTGYDHIPQKKSENPTTPVPVIVENNFIVTKEQVYVLAGYDEVQRLILVSEQEEPIDFATEPVSEPMTYPEIDPGDEPPIGDADGDGKITILDATRIQRYLAALIDETEIVLIYADFDEDGTLTILDATGVQRLLAGII